MSDLSNIGPVDEDAIRAAVEAVVIELRHYVPASGPNDPLYSRIATAAVSAAYPIIRDAVIRECIERVNRSPMIDGPLPPRNLKGMARAMDALRALLDAPATPDEDTTAADKRCAATKFIQPYGDVQCGLSNTDSHGDTHWAIGVSWPVVPTVSGDTTCGHDNHEHYSVAGEFVRYGHRADASWEPCPVTPVAETTYVGLISPATGEPLTNSGWTLPVAENGTNE